MRLHGLGARWGGVPPCGVPEAHPFHCLVSRRPRAEATCARAAPAVHGAHGGMGRGIGAWSTGAWGHGDVGALLYMCVYMRVARSPPLSARRPRTPGACAARVPGARARKPRKGAGGARVQRAHAT